MMQQQQYQQKWPVFPPTADNKGGMRDMAATGVLQFSVESRFIPHDAGVMNDGLLTALGQISSSSTTMEDNIGASESSSRADGSCCATVHARVSTPPKTIHH
jgi:hypothetical protein